MSTAYQRLVGMIGIESLALALARGVHDRLSEGNIEGQKLTVLYYAADGSASFKPTVRLVLYPAAVRRCVGRSVAEIAGVVRKRLEKR